MTRPTRARRRAVFQAFKTDYLKGFEGLKHTQVLIPAANTEEVTFIQQGDPAVTPSFFQHPNRLQEGVGLPRWYVPGRLGGVADPPSPSFTVNVEWVQFPTYRLTAWLSETDVHAGPDLTAVRRKPRAVEWLVKMWKKRGCRTVNVETIHHAMRPLSKRQLRRSRK